MRTLIVVWAAAPVDFQGASNGTEAEREDRVDGEHGPEMAVLSAACSRGVQAECEADSLQLDGAPTSEPLSGVEGEPNSGWFF